MSNHLPIRAKKDEDTGSWEFEWDEDALIYQAQVNISHVVHPCCFAEASHAAMKLMYLHDYVLHHCVYTLKKIGEVTSLLMQDGLDDVDIMYVGCLPVELDPDEQDVCASRALHALHARHLIGTPL